MEAIKKKLLSICLTVYATTAANPRESSYACYYDDERQTYLGDWYSVNWMEDSDMVSYLDEVSAFPCMKNYLAFYKWLLYRICESTRFYVRLKSTN